MDDQNQTNQPLDQNIPPVVPSLPEDITPVTTPETPAVPETPTTATPFAPVTPSYGSVPATEEPVVDIDMDEPGESPVIEPEVPQAVTPFSPEPTMPTSPVEPSPTYSPFQSVPQAPSNLMGSTTDMGNPAETPNTEETPLPAPTPEEIEMPSGKPKSKLMPVIGGIAALLLVFGVAGAAYYVSNQLSTRTAVAPNAPESEPRADPGTMPVYNKQTDQNNATLLRIDSQYSTSKAETRISADNDAAAAKAAGEREALARLEAYNRQVAESKTPTATIAKSNPLTTVVGPTQVTQDSFNQDADVVFDGVKTLVQATPASGGSGGTGGVVATTACTRGGEVSCFIPAPETNVCTKPGYTFACGSECCASNGTVCCCDGCHPAGTRCEDHACGGATSGSGTCDAAKRDTPFSKQITFAKTGKVLAMMRNGGSTGTITLSKSGSADILIPYSVEGTATELTPFNVTAGDVYTIKVQNSNETVAAYGWIPNKSANTCGPVKAPGSPVNSSGNASGFCGGEVDITPLKTLAAKTDMTGITASESNASVQCWGDSLRGDATQDYDFNDFTLAFGYETTQTVGACTLINVYKKVDGAYGTTALTTAQLQTLKVGDVVKLSLNSSMDSLQGRFRITVAGVEGGWLTGSIDATNKKLVTYSDYTIEKAGTYKFEAQVTTTP